MSTQSTKITFRTDDLISVPQAAKELGVHFTTVYRWIKNGNIHTLRIADQVYITVDEVKALKEQRANVNTNL